LRTSNKIYNILSKFKHRLYQVIQLKVSYIHSEGKSQMTAFTIISYPRHVLACIREFPWILVMPSLLLAYQNEPFSIYP